jgi:enolase
MGVGEAVAAVGEEIAPVVEGRDVFDQRGLDDALVDLDGTRSLSRLGANAVLGVSGAALRAASDCAGEPLYRFLADDTDSDPGLPVPMVNVISGGLHARGGIEIQDVLVIPHAGESVADRLEAVWAVRQVVRDRLLEGDHRPLVADEGGFAPPLEGIDAAFELLVDAIDEAGYVPGDELSLAVDVAATHFYDPDADRYEIESLARSFTPDELVDLVVGWTERFPLVSVEDPLAEDDWSGWRRLRERLGDGVQLLGDDLIVTDGARLERAIGTGAADAVLVKPNQAGTITRAIDVVDHARREGVAPVISARSGETCDSTIADLAVGLDAGQIKIGSLARSERLAKYNRLLEIERFGDPEPPSVSTAAFGPE